MWAKMGIMCQIQVKQVMTTGLYNTFWWTAVKMCLTKKYLISYVSLPNHILEVCITHQSSSFCSRSKMKTRTKLPLLIFRMPLFCSIIATNKTKIFVNKFKKKKKNKKLFQKLNQKLQLEALVLTILGCEQKFIKCI